MTIPAYPLTWPAAVADEAIIEVAARAIYKKQGFPFEWDDVDAAYRDIATDLARTALTATASLAQPQDLEAQAVDLEQFREAVELLKEAAVSKAKAHEYTWGSPPESWQREGLALAEANRLLAIIDAQSANESAPDALVRIAGELERIDGHPISGIGRSLAESLRGRAHILRAAAIDAARGEKSK